MSQPEPEAQDAGGEEPWPPSPWTLIWKDRPDAPSFWLTRFVILRLLGFVYLMSFATAIGQWEGLLGSNGLLPAADFLAHMSRDGFWEIPSVFWLSSSDGFVLAIAWIGAALAALVTAGYANAIIMVILWALHMSFAHVGQTWYAFGWEIQLLESGFLAIFLCPLLDPRPFPRRAPPVIVLWLYRWLIIRIMLGAGLIKLRGDACWTDLTCLVYHYETQPIPNPLSPLFHFMPVWAHKAGVAFNHFVELVVPFFAFGPRVSRHVAGVFLLALQVILILSGNLSYLNYLTIVPIVACFDDGLLGRVLPRALRERAAKARATAVASQPQRVIVGALLILVATLSIEPVGNLFSRRQQMNTSFQRLHLVNTYGAFGSVGKIRPEIVFEGTHDEVITDDTVWTPYEFKCKPGDPNRRPCLMSPYHYRLDWLIWFAAMGNPRQYPWTVHLCWKLLHNEPAALGLLDDNPFPSAPPRHVRVELYEYELAPLSADAFWIRRHIGNWIPPVSRDDPGLHQVLRSYGWLEE